MNTILRLAFSRIFKARFLIIRFVTALSAKRKVIE